MNTDDTPSSTIGVDVNRLNNFERLAVEIVCKEYNTTLHAMQSMNRDYVTKTPRTMLVGLLARYCNAEMIALIVNRSYNHYFKMIHAFNEQYDNDRLFRSTFDKLDEEILRRKEEIKEKTMSTFINPSVGYSGYTSPSATTDTSAGTSPAEDLGFRNPLVGARPIIVDLSDDDYGKTEVTIGPAPEPEGPFVWALQVWEKIKKKK